jgi:hypothetical protein
VLLSAVPMMAASRQVMCVSEYDAVRNWPQSIEAQQVPALTLYPCCTLLRVNFISIAMSSIADHLLSDRSSSGKLLSA